MNERPFATLTEIIARRGTGEYVCVGASRELHVFLQSGRIAWATDSAAPFAFSRHLLARSSMSRETFAEVLEICRRERLALGETLMHRGLATLDEIRDALEHPIRSTIEAVRKSADGKTIFLEREFGRYDARLTFALTDVVEDGFAETGELLERLQSEVVIASWFELFEGESPLGRTPPAAHSDVPSDLLVHSVLDGSDVVTLRSTRGTLLGVALSDARRSVFCRVPSEAPFGAALTSILDICGERRSSVPGAIAPAFPPEAHVRTGVFPILGERTASATYDALSTFLAQAPEVVGAIVMEGSKLVAASIREEWEEAPLADIVRRRAVLLDATLPFESPAAGELEKLGYRQRSVATGERDVWCFGSETNAGRRTTVWLFTSRATAQGLGWAYLTSLTRELQAVRQSAPEQAREAS